MREEERANQRARAAGVEDPASAAAATNEDQGTEGAGDEMVEGDIAEELMGLSVADGEEGKEGQKGNEDGGDSDDEVCCWRGEGFSSVRLNTLGASCLV